MTQQQYNTAIMGSETGRVWMAYDIKASDGRDELSLETRAKLAAIAVRDVSAGLATVGVAEPVQVYEETVPAEEFNVVGAEA